MTEYTTLQQIVARYKAITALQAPLHKKFTELQHEKVALFVTSIAKSTLQHAKLFGISKETGYKYVKDYKKLNQSKGGEI